MTNNSYVYGETLNCTGIFMKVKIPDSRILTALNVI